MQKLILDAMAENYTTQWTILLVIAEQFTSSTKSAARPFLLLLLRIMGWIRLHRRKL